MMTFWGLGTACKFSFSFFRIRKDRDKTSELFRYNSQNKGVLRSKSQEEKKKELMANAIHKTKIDKLKYQPWDEFGMCPNCMSQGMTIRFPPTNQKYMTKKSWVRAHIII